MGASASASDTLYDVAKDLNLSHEQRLRYKAFYSELALKGIPESTIREKLVQKFKSEKGRDLNETELKTARKIANINDDEIRSARVYKTNALIKEQNNKTNNNSEDKNIVTSNIRNDDSVKLKCDVCSSTFKTAALLERHIKYSYIHARTLEEQGNIQKQQERAKRIAVMIHKSLQAVRKAIIKRESSARHSKARKRWLWAYEKVKINIAIAKTTKDLIAYYRSNLKTQKINTAKMLFDGSKLFWRTQESIELHIYLHDDEALINSIPNKSPVLEVIGFEVSQRKEMMRLYVNYKVIQTHLCSKIESTILAMRQKVEEPNNTSFATINLNQQFDIDKLEESKEVPIMYKIITDYIVSKLDIRSHPNRPTQRGLVLGDVADDIMTNVLSKSKSKKKLFPILSHSNFNDGNVEINSSKATSTTTPSTTAIRATDDIHISSSTSNLLEMSSNKENNTNPHVPIPLNNIPKGHNNESGFNLVNLSTSVPANALIDENLVLRLIQPVEIVRRRHTTEDERNSAFADFNRKALELSHYTDQANSFVANTNIQPLVRSGLKHDESAVLDDVIAKYSNMLKDSKTSSEDLLKSSNKDIITTNTESKKQKDANSTKLTEKTIIINNTNDESKKSYMRSTVSQNPDGLSMVTKKIVTNSDGTSSVLSEEPVLVVKTSPRGAQLKPIQTGKDKDKESTTNNNTPKIKDTTTPTNANNSNNTSSSSNGVNKHAAGSGLAAVKSIGHTNPAPMNNNQLPSPSGTGGTGRGNMSARISQDGSLRSARNNTGRLSARGEPVVPTNRDPSFM